MVKAEARDAIGWLEVLEPTMLEQSVAIDNAKDALKYRIPEAPEKIRQGRYVKSVGQCPVCGRLVDSSGNYCKRCGKALDWTGGSDGQVG